MAARSKSTSFPTVESPISESGDWQAPTTTSFTNRVNVTTAGKASGLSGSGTNDAVAYLTGSWGLEQDATCTVFIGAISADEIEFHFRASWDTSNLFTYEIDIQLALSNGIAIVKWNGPQSDITILPKTLDLGFNGSVPPSNGDTFRARVVTVQPGLIRFDVWQNGTLIAQAFDSVAISGTAPYTTGVPGIGFDNQAAGPASAMTSYSVTTTDAPPVVTTQPKTTQARIGQTFTLTVAGTGVNSLTYQWQDNSTGVFADISGQTSSSITIGPVTDAMNGRIYRCNVIDVTGGSSTLSEPAPLQVVNSGSTVLSSEGKRLRGFALLDVGRWGGFGGFKGVEKWVADELAPASGGGTQTKTLTASTSVAAAAVRSIGAIRVAAQAGNPSLARQAAAVRSVTQAATATLATSRVVLRTLAATIAQSAAVVRSVSALRSASAASAATVRRAVNAARSAAAASTATVQRAAALVRSAATSGTPTLSLLKAKFLTFSASSALAPALVRAVSSTKAVTQAGAATLLRAASKTLTAVESSSATVSTLKARLLTLSTSIGSTATLRRAVNATRSAAAAATGVVLRAVAASKAATSAGAASLVRAPSLVRSAVQASTATATRTRVALLVLSASTAAAATLRRATAATKAASTATAGTLAKVLPPKVFAASQPMAASLQKVLEQAVEVLSTFFAYDVPMASLFYDVRSSSLGYDVPSIGGNGLYVNND